MIEQLVIEPSESLEIGEDRTEIIVVTEAVEIIEVGVLGPPGRPGRDGLNAEGALAWSDEVFAISVDDTHEFTLAFEPTTGSVLLYLNGLYERQFTVIADVVTVDSGVPVLAGDTITIKYQRDA